MTYAARNWLIVVTFTAIFGMVLAYWIADTLQAL